MDPKKKTAEHNNLNNYFQTVTCSVPSRHWTTHIKKVYGLSCYDTSKRDGQITSTRKIKA